jgi:hypothetical protein
MQAMVCAQRRPFDPAQWKCTAPISGRWKSPERVQANLHSKRSAGALANVD